MTEFSEIQSPGWVLNAIGIVVVTGMAILLWKYAERRKLYLFCFVPFVLLIVYFMIEKLETRIDDTGIHYRMRPAQFTERTIEWKDIVTIEIRDYVNYNTGRGNRYDSYSIFNKYGLYITIDNNDKIIILGTKKPREINNKLRELVNQGKLTVHQFVY